MPDSIQTLKQNQDEGGALPGGKWCNEENALYIGGLPEDTCDVDLYEIFSTFGAIPFQGVRAMQNQDGQCTGYGFVNFAVGPEGKKACEMAMANLHGTILASGRLMKVTYVKKKAGQGFASDRG